jgi:hypothetical protein
VVPGRRPKRQRRGPPGGVLKGPKDWAGDRRREPELSGESISPGRRGLQSCEVDEEVTNPRGEGDLCGETPRSTYLEAPKTTGSGCARGPKVKGEGVAVERRCGPASKGGWKPSTRLFRCYSWCWNGLTWHKGLRSLESRSRRLRAEGTCSGSRAWTGREPEAWKEKAPEGQKPRRVSAGW